MALLQIGDDAPSFDLKSSGGGHVSSDDLKSPAVFVFYPANNTPG